MYLPGTFKKSSKTTKRIKCRKMSPELKVEQNIILEMSCEFLGGLPLLSPYLSSCRMGFN